MVMPHLTTFDPEDGGEIIQGLTFHKEKFAEGIVYWLLTAGICQFIHCIVLSSTVFTLWYITRTSYMYAAQRTCMTYVFAHGVLD